MVKRQIEEEIDMDKRRADYYRRRAHDHLEAMQQMIKDHTGLSLPEAVRKHRDMFTMIGTRYIYNDYKEVDDFLFVLTEYDHTNLRIKQHQLQAAALSGMPGRKEDLITEYADGPRITQSQFV